MDLELHLQKRFKNVIKFFNFLKDNQCAPISIKLKVLKACVVSTLLYNCEAFGHRIPQGLEELYHKLIKATLNVRQSTSNALAIIESGLLPLHALIYSRQLKFYKRFKISLKQNSTRSKVLNNILNSQNRSEYIDHYENLEQRYAGAKDIQVKYLVDLKNSVKELNNCNDHYKHWIYIQLNPLLQPSPFLQLPGKTAQAVVKFRLGSHNLEIEKGRWARIPRQDRKCKDCNVIGDEFHVIYNCKNIYREDIINDLPDDLASLWNNSNLVYKLFSRLIKGNYVD